MQTLAVRVVLSSLLALVGASTVAAQGQELDLVWADRWNSAYHRFSDADGDGTFNGDGEVSFLLNPASPASASALGMEVTVENGQPVAYWLVQFQDTIARGVDLNSDGVLSGAAEIQVFRDSGALDGESAPQALAIAADGAIWWAAGLVIAIPHNGISRIEDLNGDGDAEDPGEHALMVDGNAAHTVEHDAGSSAIAAWGFQSLAAAGNGVLAYTEPGGNAVYRFEDLNSDGDVTDAGESVLMLNASGADSSLPMNPDFVDGTLPSMQPMSGGPARFTLLASALEGGERAFYFGTSVTGTSPGPGNTNVDGLGINFLLFRGVDGNGDRDVNDAGEVQLFFDGSHTSGSPSLLSLRALAVADGGTAYAVGLQPYPVLFPGPNGNTWIHRLVDGNGDGDALDPGEKQLEVFDLQVFGDLEFFPNPPLFGNMMADPWDLSISPRLLFEPAFRVSESGCSFPTGPVPVATGLGSGIQGSDFTFSLDGALSTSLAAWTFGTSTTNWLGLPLPLDLGGFGYTGCTLYQNLQGSASTSTDGSGHAEFTGSVPVSPALAGLEVPTQWLVFGIGALQTTGLGWLLIK